ncbi:MAG: DUF167 domain-containing protein [Proteobacteria bacterium]|nr:DUF167 domain-containing protein [Pseudomonadota bacterium]
MINVPYQIKEGSFFLYVKIIPKASFNGIQSVFVETNATYLKIALTAAPEDGKANKALLSLLAKTLKLAKNSFEIIKGEKDRKKIIHIQGDSSSLKLLMEKICQKL